MTSKSIAKKGKTSSNTEAEDTRPRCEFCGVPIARGEYAPVPPSLRKEPTGDHRIAIIGEAPGRDEHRRGEPFVGYSGRILRRTLAAIGLDPEEIYFNNICCCRPIEVVGAQIKDRKPEAREISVGRVRLLKELEEFRPDVIIAVGNTACEGLLQINKATISKLRGEWHSIQLGDRNIPVMPTYHPAAMLRDASPFPDFVLDLQRAAKIEILEWSYPELKIIETYEEFKEFASHLQELKANTELRRFRGKLPLMCDIETNSLSHIDGKILCISFTPVEGKSWVVTDDCLKDPGNIEILRSILCDEDYTVSNHNIHAFDQPYISHQYGINFIAGVDTMLLHYVLDERAGCQGLKVLSKNYFGIPDYSKDLHKYISDEGVVIDEETGEEKKGYGRIPRKILYKYASMDTDCNYKLLWSLVDEMNEQPYLWKVYDMISHFAPRLSEVEKNGTLLDKEYLAELDKQWTERINIIVEEIRSITGRATIKPRSPKQIAEALFDDLDLTCMEYTRAGNRATGKAVLKKLKLQLNKNSTFDQEIEHLIDLILEARSMMMNLATFVRGFQQKTHSDGKIRPHLLLARTGTGRVAAVGPNVQNVPKHGDVSTQFRKGIVAAPGKVFIESDYSALELRVAAWYSRDKAMIADFNAGLDIHRLVACRMAAAQGIIKQPEEITKDERFHAKFIDFGASYGRQAPSIAEELRISVHTAQELLDSYFAGYPDFYLWTKEIRAFVQEHQYVESAFGRRRRWGLITEKNLNDVQNEALNMPIQSMGSDLNLYALCRCHDELPRELFTGLFPVHDSIFAEVPIDAVEYVLPEIVSRMEDVEYYGIEKRVPFKAEAAVGTRWGTLTEVKDLQSLGISLSEALAEIKKDPWWHLEEDKVTKKLVVASR